MAYPRESSFMPTIKCSMCAADIAISQMGEHICGAAPPLPSGEPTPPPDSYSSFDRMPYNYPSNGPGVSKPGRQMPPRVDTSAANRPFFRPQEQLTPVSASPSRTGSPFQQNGRNSPFGRPTRNGTAQIQRPPSPELMSGLDSPFPPFPGMKGPSRPRTPQPPPPPAKSQIAEYGGFGIQKYQGDPSYAPVSPRTATAGGLLQRMNTIAPGPFDPNGRRGPVSHQRTRTTGSVKDDLSSTGVSGANGHMPATSISSLHSHSSKNSLDRGTSAPKVPRKNGYGGFGPPASGDNGLDRSGQPQDYDFKRPAMSSENRSQTFPRQSRSQEPSMRRPSESAVGTDLRMRQQSVEASNRNIDNGNSNYTSPPRGRRPSAGPDTSRPPPPRGASLVGGARSGSRSGDGPPVPSKVNLAAEFGIGNPYHTPSESASSNGSGYSVDSKASSRSSPPTTSPARSRRNPSDTTNIDMLMSEIQSSMTDLQPKEIKGTAPSLKITTALPIRNQNLKSTGPSYGAQEAKPFKSSYGVQEPKPLKSSYGVQEPLPFKSSYGVQEPDILSPESPPDPAVQGGRFSPLSRNGDSPPTLARTKTSANPSRRPTTSKGTCKHCQLPIKSGQKSVSSADGRLSGRYHKTCFCCTTCLEPFSTSTFYVINDAPYCERHYHKLNGSVCTTCDRGIEGQYLESEARQKFHPQCLTCADCKRALRNDYFEMDGQVYCERDAFRRTQQQRANSSGGRGASRGGLMVPGAGTSRMQRRTTRLMMM